MGDVRPRLVGLRWIARTVAASAAVVALSSVGCAKESSNEVFEETQATTTEGTTIDRIEHDAPDPAPPPADFPEDGLEIVTLTEGEGAAAVDGDTLTVHYVGKLADGSVFDESWSRNEAFPVTLGQGMVIPGWEEGLLGAKVGERRRLVIGSRKAYGAQGAGGVIPPNAALVFEIDVLEIH